MLTEENILKFEKEDSEFETALGWWWRIYHQLKEQQKKLHQDFRIAHDLSTYSNFQHIADWRWKNKGKQ